MPIVYGYPSPELETAVARGEAVLGGCLLPQPRKWACPTCGYRWPLPPEAVQSELVAAALAFAYQAHGKAIRKGDGTLYADHPIEVAHLLYEAGFGDEVVAAGLLHDVVEDTDTTVAVLAERFGGEVAALVDAVTHDDSIEGWDDLKTAHRDKVARIGGPAVAIYAADKLANLRAFRAAYRDQGEALGEKFNASIDDKVEAWRDDLEMLRRSPEAAPFVQPLELALRRFLIDRAARGARK